MMIVLRSEIIVSTIRVTRSASGFDWIETERCPRGPAQGRRSFDNGKNKHCTLPRGPLALRPRLPVRPVGGRNVCLRFIAGSGVVPNCSDVAVSARKGSSSPPVEPANKGRRRWLKKRTYLRVRKRKSVFGNIVFQPSLQSLRHSSQPWERIHKLLSEWRCYRNATRPSVTRLEKPRLLRGRETCS